VAAVLFSEIRRKACATKMPTLSNAIAPISNSTMDAGLALFLRNACTPDWSVKRGAMPAEADALRAGASRMGAPRSLHSIALGEVTPGGGWGAGLAALRFLESADAGSGACCGSALAARAPLQAAASKGPCSALKIVASPTS
jgi:hypothetical protein